MRTNIYLFIKFNWNPEKNEILKTGQRSVSFEEISEAMECGKVIKDFPHPNCEKYPNQRIAWVFFRDYVWQVPYVIQPDGTRFLKTALQQAAHETMEEIRAKRAANATKPITLRVPVRVIERYKRRAAANGVKYQTLMNEILDAAPV